MTHQTVCVALWAGLGSKVLLQRLHERPLLQRTLERVEASRCGAVYTLIPWGAEHDGLFGELGPARWHATRCHPDERIAMRDLVARFRSDVGVLVQGQCADVDVAEILLACRVQPYKSARVASYAAEDWLRARDTEEWGPIRSLDELRAFYAHPKLLEDDTRAIRARANRGS